MARKHSHDNPGGEQGGRRGGGWLGRHQEDRARKTTGENPKWNWRNAQAKTDRRNNIAQERKGKK